MKRFKGYRGVATVLSTVMMMNGLGVIAPLVAAPLSVEEIARTSAKFNFGLTPKEGYINITSGQIYDQSLGYGFSTEEYLEAAKGWMNGVYYPRAVTKLPANAKYIKDEDNSIKISSKVWKETESTGYGVYTYENTSTFDIDLESKDYNVTVELTNPTSESISVYLEAEDITKVSGVEIQPGETKTCSFIACLVDGQLNLKFLASSNAVADSEALEKGVYVSKVEVEQITRTQGEKPTIFIASDSTVQTYERNYYPQTGWGQVLFNFFKGGDHVNEYECTNCNYSQAQTYETDAVIIENRAIGGRSSKSFIEEGKIDDLLEDVKPGDFVLVQWGHNDATASRPNRYVSSEDFEKYLQYYIDGAAQRGATCVLVTPVARRSYNELPDGTVSFNSNFEAYRQVMLKMGQEQNIPVLDLTQASIEVCNKFGAEGSKSLFLWLNAGDYPDGAYAGGVSDSTHLQYYGAYKFAQCVAELIQEYSKDNQLDGLKSLVEMPVNFTDVPSVPTGLETTTIGASSISLKWNKQDDAELYYIYRAELKEGQTADDIIFTAENKYSVSSTPKYTDSTCVGGSTYVYAIAGFNECGIGEFSEKITVTTKSALYKYDFCQVASNPTMKNWVSVHSTQKYNETDGYGWIIAPGNGRYRANNGNSDSNDMTDDFCLGAGEFAVDLPNGEYEVKITACDLLPGTSTIKPSYTAEGLSIGGISTKQAAGTLSASVKVSDGQLNIGVGGTNPYINGLEITPVRLSPTGFTYQELSFNEDQANFLLNWDDVSGATTYNVYRKTSSDNQFTVHKVITQEEKNNATTLPFTADLGETVEYYVTAVFEDGTETPPSKTIQIEMIDKNGVPPIAPTDLICISADNNKIELKWNSVDKAIKYIVYRSDREEGQKGYKEYQKVAEVKGTTFIDESVTTNVNWYYKVLAVNAAGPGELSSATQTPITTSLIQQPAEVLTDRGLVAINLSGDLGVGTNVDEKGKEGTKVSSAEKGVYLSWRLFEADPSSVSFTLYKNGDVLVDNLTATNYLDSEGTIGDTYEVVGSSDRELGLNSRSVVTWQNHYLELTLDKPEDQVMPDGTTCTYTANDMSVADLDGDGQYELIVKWYPSNAQDNSRAGYTGTTILDAYDIDINTGSSTRMWRIDLGINIRSGAHYTQFQAWDLDGDGKAEIACKTADGTIDGKGNVIGDVGADYRNSGGYVLDGPEYFTVFSGETGEALDTVDYIPARGKVSAWGDGYGNRVDRFLSCIAYLDGETPSFIAGRGYYTRTCLTAYHFKNGKIEIDWTFDTDIAGSEYEAQGNHGVAVADIDADGKDEIIYGALVIDHDGTVKYSTGLGHGDAMHVSDWVPSNSGLEIMSVHEHSDAEYQVELHDAETGEILTGFFTGKDTGRGIAADIDPTQEGAEFWSSIEWDGNMGGLYSSTSTLDELVKLSDRTPSVNFSIYWDGDLLAELQDHTFNNKDGNYYPVSTNITKWDYENNESITLFESSEIFTSNGTKGNVGLVADIMGDWREEIVARTSDEENDKIRIYSTTIETDYSLPTLMEDHEYRLGIAWQNVGYNQPAHTSYLISEGIRTAEVTVADTSKEAVTLAWSEASDGVYGHEVEGYKVYRYSEASNQYEVIGTTSAESRLYVDEDIEANTTYSYKVAAIVKGRDSFCSLAVEVTTQLDIASVPALEAVELVQGDSAYELCLPETVAVIDKAGNKVEGIKITWDLKEFNIEKLGTVTLYGTIKGYEELVPLTVTVIENSVVGFEDLVDLSTIVNVAPELPETLIHVMKDGTTKSMSVDWDTTTLDYTKIGEYVIKGKSELTENILLTIYVKENYIVSVEKFDMIEVFQGDVPVLPTHVKVTYADHSSKEIEVTWESVNTDNEGMINVRGYIEGYEEAITIVLNIIKEPLYRFDFGISGNHVADGWIGVTVNPKGGLNATLGAYTEELGYGFADVNSTTLTDAIQGRYEDYTYEGSLDKSVYTDFAIPDGKQFIVDLPNGNYTVQIVGGSFYKSNVKGYVEDERINISNLAGEYAIQTINGVVVEDGQMNFVFDTGATSRMNAIIITAEEIKESDIEAPVFSYEGPSTIEIVNGEGFTAPEIKAVDLVDGDVEVEVTITNSEGEELVSIDTTVAGTYRIVYSASDTAGNKAEMMIMVVVLEKSEIEGPEEPEETPDTEAPLFIYGGKDSIKVTNGEAFTVPEVKAVDLVDGEVEVEVIITNSNGEEIENINTTVAGTYIINYTAEDKAGNLSEMTITVIVEEEIEEPEEPEETPDTEVPLFIYGGKDSIEVANGEAFTIPEVKAVDLVDGEVEVEATIINSEGEELESIDTAVTGTYRIVYSASDAAGNKAEMVITVVVLEEGEIEEPEEPEETPDTEAPLFIYGGKDSIKVANGEAFTVPEVKAVDLVDGEVEVEVTITNSSGEEVGNIDTIVADTYIITYTAEDKAGNQSEMTITVIVEEEEIEEPEEPEETPDTEAPLFVYGGPLSIEVSYGQSFIAPEVKAVDLVDGEVEVEVTITNSEGEEVESIDTTVSGTYQLKYQAADQAGNEDSLIITVVVKEKLVEQPSEDDEEEDDDIPYIPSRPSGNGNIESSTTTSVEEVIDSALEEGKNPVVYVDKNGQLNILNETVKQIVKSDKQLVIKLNDTISIGINAQTLKEQGNGNMDIKVTQATQELLKKVNEGINASEALHIVGGGNFVATVEVNTDKTTSFTEPITMTFDLSKEKVNNPSKLVAVRYEMQVDGTMKGIKIGGTYDAATGQFNFLTDQTGTFGLVEAEQFVKITLVSNAKEAVINDKPVFSDVAPIVVNSRLMLPVRFIAESLGAEVGYKQGKVTITLDEQTIDFKVGENLEGYDVKPFIQDSRTYISARWVAETLGANVLWIPSTSSVQIVK